MDKKIKLIISLLTFICLILPASANENIFAAKGEVLKIKELERQFSESDEFLDPGSQIENSKTQIIEVKTPNGKVIEAENELRGSVLDFKIKKGDQVALYGIETENGIKYYVKDFWHLDAILFWIVLIVISILVIGKKSGAKALLSLLLSLVLIFFVLIPLVSKGINAILITILISLFVTIISVFIILGTTRRAYSAIAGTLGGVIFASILAWLIGITSNLNGLGTEDARILAINFPEINFKNLLFAGMIIGSLGAVMDTSVSIASGLSEVKKAKKSISFKELFNSGINIGRDIMGSMLNTLIFAYIGASFSLVLLLVNFETSISEAFNLGFISEEITRSLAGSFGLIMTIPLTSFFSAYFFSRKE